MSSHIDDSSYRRNRLVERIRKSRENLEDSYSENDRAIVKLLQDYLYYKKKDYGFDLDTAKEQFYAISFSGRVTPASCFTDMLPYVWGLFPLPSRTNQILGLISKDIDPIFISDAFLRSVVSTADGEYGRDPKYSASVGVILDDLTCYYDATRPSRMELILNSGLELSEQQSQRARGVMKSVLAKKISKYNNQPEYIGNTGRSGASKVLVVDQSYGDASIAKGLADESTFQRMLECAVQENPEADIIIKTHPDTLGEASLRPRCYYQHIETRDNIYRLTAPANPVSLIQQADKVYVCSSQFGFEALMLGKKVYTFGMPFYAGWGLTTDALRCPRRTRQRSLEEIFYVAYILLSAYFDPESGKQWEVEDAVAFLDKNRNLYFEGALNE